MLNRLMQKLEDPKNPLLGPNLKALRFIGILLPDRIILKYLLAFLNLSVICFVITEYVDIWMNRSQLDFVLVNLKSSMSSTFNGFKVITMYIWQTRWKCVINYVTKADINQRKSSNPINIKIINSFTKYCRKITYIYWVLIFITGLSVILNPLFKYITTPDIRHNFTNGIETNMAVVPSWVPWDQKKLGGYLAASVLQIYATIVGIGWVSAFDSYAIVVLVFFRVELEVLRNDCGDIFGSPDVFVDEEETRRRIKDCHRRYIDLLKCTRYYNYCMSPVMLFYMFACSIMLCVTAYEFSEDTSIIEGFLIAEYLIFGISQLLFFCWHCNEVIFASKDLMLGPYESRWWTGSIPRQKDICKLIHQYRESIVFTAGPFTDLTMATFISIIKGAYSYYTLLKQSKNE